MPMISVSQYKIAAVILAGMLFSAGGRADVTLWTAAAEDGTALQTFADFRFRFEQDWNSRSSDGTEREDRARDRIRARLGLRIAIQDDLELLARVRTGSYDSQQSPHITVNDFQDNPTGDKDGVFDKFYLKYKNDRLWLWGGRNEFPFWKQHELFWDDDVTLIGGAAGFRHPLGMGSIAGTAGYFLLPDGMEVDESQGEMIAGQLAYTQQRDKLGLTAALGIYAMEGEGSPANPGKNLRKGNGTRDYTILTGSLQGKTQLANIPITVGFDYMHNLEDYSAAELAPFFSAADNVKTGDRDGFVTFIHFGQQNKAGDWLVGYYYADIETFAVNASYAQDDWMRWGSATQTDASDFHGHEARLGYVLPWNVKVLARLYIVESNNNPQDGNRFRIDLNRSF